MNENEQECVEFASKSSALPGAISGAVIGVGVPAVTLLFGKALAPSIQMIISLVGVGVGGLIALTATFFSLVIPSKVNGYGGGCSCGKTGDSQGAGSFRQTQTL